MCVFMRPNTLLLCIFAHGVGERRRHDLVAPLLHPWRERREQSCWRVGWHSSSCWLLCLWCVLCFVFCPPTNDQTTVPFFSWRNFFQFPTDGRTTLPFFPVIILSSCNLNPLKNMAGQTTVHFFPVLTFPPNLSRLHWPDDCTFYFSGHNFSGCNLNHRKKRPVRRLDCTLFFRL